MNTNEALKFLKEHLDYMENQHWRHTPEGRNYAKQFQKALEVFKEMDYERYVF